MPSLNETGEFGLIDRIAALHSTSAGDLLHGIGGDCAVVRVADAIQLISTDASVEGVHFRRDWSSPYDIGWKATASALSDIAGMGGEARFVLTSLAIPESEDTDLLLTVAEGIRDAAQSVGAVVIGGDTTRSPNGLVIDVTVIGEAVDGNYHLRSGAHSGDMLLITGTPGRSRAGLLALQNGLDAPELVRTHLHPEPRIEHGRWFVENPHVHAMMDVSDGIAQDAGHLARAAKLGVGMTSASVAIDPELLPVCLDLGLSMQDLVFAGGEDYELAVAVDPKHSLDIIDAFRRDFDMPIYAIGTFSDKFEGVKIDGESVDALGFDHFRQDT
jgi:thiamine-monophosphate kinase